MILLIDNYDSFTYNLVQMIESLGQEVKVFRNDKIAVAEMDALRPSALVISPGPCTPKEAGVSVAAIDYFASRVPVMGVCLGHQCVAAAFGGEVVRADRLMHGKTSPILHDDKTIFKGLPSPFTATRYHSLIVKKKSIPESLEISAWTEEGEIMGLRHREYRVEGVQFHPESILTKSGVHVMRNFLGLNS